MKQITGEPCGVWVRVSSDAQTEANQIPDINAHVESHGYHVERRYVLHDKSAFKGEQVESLNQMLADMASGVITVLVIWSSDRLDRRGPKYAWGTLAAAELAGGRIESVQDPEFGGDSIGDELLTSMRMSRARDESKLKRERNLIARETIHANGGLDGKPPWGFETGQGVKLNRPLVPTAQAREYVPQIYGAVIAGKTLADICRWLQSEGVKPTGIAKQENAKGKSGKWWPGVLADMIRNPIYMGIRVNGDGVTTATYDPPLVTADVWQAANQALTGRPKRRGPVLAENRSYLSGPARCYWCSGPMYRIRTYLRCAGSGADRKTCSARNTISLAVAEQLASDVLGSLSTPEYAVKTVSGNGPAIAAKLARIEFERGQVARRPGLTWDQVEAEMQKLRKEWEKVNATPRTPDHREFVPTGESKGDRWKRLSVDGKAEFLRSEIQVFFAKGRIEQADGYQDGVSIFLKWMDEIPDE